jgi:hypothetical protein
MSDDVFCAGELDDDETASSAAGLAQDTRQITAKIGPTVRQKMHIGPSLLNSRLNCPPVPSTRRRGISLGGRENFSWISRTAGA